MADNNISMRAQFWKKQVVVQVMLSGEDNADWCPALPLLLSARWNHYIGFYYQLIQDFFSPFQPFPYTAETFWLELPAHSLRLTGTEIVAHLFTLYSQPANAPLQLLCHFRSPSPLSLDLKRYFKNNLKASTCIRYGKFGSSVITVDMSVSNIDDMFANFRDSNLEAYLGAVEPEATNLGYRFITQNKERIDCIGVRVLGRQVLIERRVPKERLLKEWWEQVGGQVELYLHGVPLAPAHLEVKIALLEAYCHPDGFLYFTIN